MIQHASRQQYFLQLAAKLGLRPKHHNADDLIRNCRSAEYFGEAVILERILGQTGEMNGSTFIEPFILACTEEQLKPDHVRRYEETTGHAWDKPKSFPVVDRVHQVDGTPVQGDGVVEPTHAGGGYFKCAHCSKITEVTFDKPIRCSHCQAVDRTGSLSLSPGRHADDEYARLSKMTIIDEPFFTFQQLTEEHTRWIQRNFPEQLTDPLRSEDGFDGLVEEVGELARARLKKRQGIRGTAEEWDKQIHDSVGDIVIFLNSWCIAHGINLGSCVETAWKEVRERDWKAYPKTGRPPTESEAKTVLRPGDIVHTPMGPGRIVDPREAVIGNLCLVKLDV